MPIDYRKYPKNWKKEIRPRILKRANNKCEFCGLENNSKILRSWSGRETIVVLTIAHLDHDESNHNVSDNRLAALCQKCHLSYDIEEKKKRKKEGYKYLFVPSNNIDLDSEAWKSVVGYENRYMISDMGRVKSISENSIAKNKSILSQHDHKKGYKIVSLWNGKRLNTFKVHRLVAIAFIPNPLNLPEVNHKKGVKTDNRVTELEWSTSGNNQLHAYKMGLSKPKKGTGNGRVVLNNQEVIDVFKSKEPLSVLSEKYMVSISCISHIRTGYTWSHLTSLL